MMTVARHLGPLRRLCRRAGVCNLFDYSNHEIVSPKRNHLAAPLEFLGKNQGKLFAEEAGFRNSDAGAVIVEFNQTAASRGTIRSPIDGGKNCETPLHQLSTRTRYCD
jgi:hypothetical protein